MNIPELNSDTFTWSKWRAGSLIDLGLRTRTAIIEQNKTMLNKCAVGWCKGETLLCRPKHNQVAVMFLKGDLEFWTHLRRGELDILNGVEDDLDIRRHPLA